MLNLAHHAFAWAVDVSVSVVGFPAGAICRCPINFQEMGRTLIAKIDGLNGDRANRSVTLVSQTLYVKGFDSPSFHMPRVNFNPPEYVRVSRPGLSSNSRPAQFGLD